MFRTPQSDSESDDERGHRPSSTIEKSGFDRGGSARPLFKTPFRPSLATASSASSSSSSSTASSIFDKSSIRAQTPLTPPISENIESSNATRSGLASHVNLSPKLFMERCQETGRIPSVAQKPVTTAGTKESYRALSISDSLVDGVKKLRIDDYDGTPSSIKSDFRLDISPSPAGRQHRKKEGRQTVHLEDGYFPSQTKNSDSKSRNTSQMKETTPTRQNLLNPHHINTETSRSSKRIDSRAPPLVDTQSNSEDEAVAGTDSHMTTANQGPRTTQSKDRSSHTRSRSSPGPHKPNKPAQSNPVTVVATTSNNTSPLQVSQVLVSSLNPGRETGSKSERRKSTRTSPPAQKRPLPRRRSTGSHETEPTVLPSIQIPDDDEGVPGAFPTTSADITEIKPQSAPSEPSQGTSSLESDKKRVFPVLEHRHPEQLGAVDLKNEMLRIIRRRNAAKEKPGKGKPAKTPNLDHGYVYIFKSEAYPGYVKIGSTKQAPKERIQQWGTKCKFKCVHVSNEHDKSFKFYGIVERIVHAELHNEQRRFFCGECETRHVLALAKKGEEKQPRRKEHCEWFEITEEKAKQVVNKWRDWVIHQEPYKHDAMLGARWLWKHDTGMKQMKGTEAEWEKWRQFKRFDDVLLSWYELNQWLTEVSPLLHELITHRGSAMVVFSIMFFCIFGVNWMSCLSLAIILFSYWRFYLTFC